MTTEIRIGDRVRSFDFESRALTGPFACYVVGTVIGIDARFTAFDRYAILVESCCWAGLPVVSQSAIVYPPVNGTRGIFTGATEYVERLPLALPHLTECPACKGSGSFRGASYGGWHESLCCDLCEGIGAVDAVRL